jgi:gamma-glutamyltranspeptidase / glutathione hydrolase
MTSNDSESELNAGAAAAWVDTVETFGSGKLGMAEVLEPAIRLATEGYKSDRLRHHRRRASASLISLDY